MQSIYIKVLPQFPGDTFYRLKTRHQLPEWNYVTFRASDSLTTNDAVKLFASELEHLLAIEVTGITQFYNDDYALVIK